MLAVKAEIIDHLKISPKESSAAAGGEFLESTHHKRQACFRA